MASENTTEGQYKIIPNMNSATKNITIPWEKLFGKYIRNSTAPTPKKKVITELPSYENTLLQIYFNPDGLFQYLERIKPEDRRVLDSVVDYLIHNGATKVFVTGSSLSKREYNDIDIAATVPDTETGAELLRRLIHGKKPKGIKSVEDNSNVEYFLDNIEYRLTLNPEDKKAVPVDLTIVTEKTLEEQIA